MDISQNFRVLWEVLKKRSLEKYIELSFMHVCKYLNQRLKIIWEYNEKLFKGVSETKHMKWLSFTDQLKIDFLLPFNSCRKVLGRMPGVG